MPVDTPVTPAGEVAPEVSDTSDEGGDSAGNIGQQDAQSIADSVDPVKQAQAKAKADAAAADEDPEIEFGDDLKMRKSEVAKAIRKRKELDRASFERFQQAAEIRKQLDQLKEADPEEFFKLRGIDPTQYAVEKLQRELQMRDASPEQRRSMELEQQLAQERGIRAEHEKRFETQQFEAERQRYVEKLDKELPVAMTKAGLHTDPLTFSLVAQQIRHQVLAGIPEDYEAAAEDVAETFREGFKKHTATLKYEDAVKQYPELVKLIREGDLASARTSLPVKNTASKTDAAPRTQPSQKPRQWAMDDWAASGVRVRQG